MLVVLLTGFGKSLFYQYVQQLGCLDFVPRGVNPVHQDSAVLVVFPLSAVMNKQINKLEAFLNVCILQSIVENEVKQKVTVLKISTSVVCFLHIQRSMFVSMVRQKCLQERGLTR